ncbi:MAG: hypothetical protein HYY13_08000 [Nitrospirae bacterium]|nr:hypothetical protein [Nitrospirota bacterium]
MAIFSAVTTACGRSGSEDLVRPLPIPSVVVDDSGDAGVGASLKFDARGMPHIAYHDIKERSLKYIYFAKTGGATGRWLPQIEIDVLDEFGLPTGQVTTIKGQVVDQGQKSSGDGVGKWSSLLLDRLNRPHVVYYDDDNKQLKYAWALYAWSDGSWSCYPEVTRDRQWCMVWLDPDALNVGRWVAALLDDSDRQDLHVAYVDATSRKVKYLTWCRLTSCGEGGVAWDPKVDGDRVAVAGAFVDPGALANGEQPSKTAIALSRSDAEEGPDTLYILYYDPNQTALGRPDGNLRLARKVRLGGEWEILQLDDLLPGAKTPGDKTPSDVGQWASLTVDLRGRLHISYTDALSGDLKYLVYSPALTRWYPRFRTIKNFDRGTLQVLREDAPTTAEGSANIVLVSEQSLAEVTQPEGQEVIEETVGQVVEDGTGPGTGLESTIAMGPNGRPLVSYRDGATGDLKLAVQLPTRVNEAGVSEGTSWEILTIDTPKIVGLWSSMASFTYSQEVLEGWVIGVAYEGFEQKADGALVRRLLFRVFNPFVMPML